jgi:hypothetical protein
MSKEPFVWENIFNDPTRDEEIEGRYAEAQKQAEEAYAKVKRDKRMRTLEEAAKYVMFALVLFTASALLIEVGIVWASWLTGIAGVLAGMAASYQFGILRGSNRK